VVRSSVTSGYQSGRHRDYGVTVYGRAVVGVVSLAGHGRGGRAGQLSMSLWSAAQNQWLADA